MFIYRKEFILEPSYKEEDGSVKLSVFAKDTPDGGETLQQESRLKEKFKSSKKEFSELQFKIISDEWYLGDYFIEVICGDFQKHNSDVNICMKKESSNTKTKVCISSKDLNQLKEAHQSFMDIANWKKASASAGIPYFLNNCFALNGSLSIGNFDCMHTSTRHHD